MQNSIDQHYQFEWEPCIICRSWETKPLFSKRYKDLTVNVVQCQNCGLVYLNPRVKRLEARERLYSDSAPETGTPGSGRITLKYLDSLLPARGKILDFVCRQGTFLQTLRDKFALREIELYGVEIRPAFVKIACDKGIKAHYGPIEEVDLPEEFFDVITMRHTLEHLYNPNIALTKVHKILKQNGYLIVEVPNIASLDRMVLGQHWPGFMLPYHVYHFSPSTLAKFLEKQGFHVERIDFYPASLVGSVSHFLSLHYSLFRGSETELSGKSFLRSVLNFLLMVFLFPPSLTAASLKRSGAMAVLCKKEARSLGE